MSSIKSRMAFSLNAELALKLLRKILLFVHTQQIAKVEQRLPFALQGKVEKVLLIQI